MPHRQPAQRPLRGDTIIWYGQSCFHVIDAEGHTVLLDPYAHQVMGQSLEGLTADVVVVTTEQPDHNATQAIDARHVIHALEKVRGGRTRRIGDAPTGLIFTLVPTPVTDGRGERNAAVVWIQAGITICHLGDLVEPLTPEQVEQIGHPDVLMLPIGGHITLDGEEARRVVEQLQPHVVIPMHFRVPNLAPELAVETEEPFLQADGSAPWDTVQRLHSPELTLDADHLPHGIIVDILEVAHVD